MLTRDQILAFDDLTTKVLTIPETIPVWGGQEIRIKQLSRGQQDNYARRRFGKMEMQQDQRGRKQDIKGVDMWGHDAWVVVCGCIDEEGNPLFKHEDEAKLNQKSGEAIGWIAKQITDFSGMADDDAVKNEAEITYFRKLHPDDAEKFQTDYASGVTEEVKN